VLAASLAIDGSVLFKATQTLIRRAEEEEPEAVADIRRQVIEDLTGVEAANPNPIDGEHDSIAFEAAQPPHAAISPEEAARDASMLRRIRAKVREASSRAALVYRHLMTTNDPFVAAVFLEDSVACFGVLLAVGGIALTHITGSAVFDALASVMIGGLLGGVAVRLVKMNQTFLLGQSVDPGIEADIRDMIEQWPSIEHVGEVQTQWLGPKAFSFKAEVDFDGTWLAAKLHSEY